MCSVGVEGTLDASEMKSEEIHSASGAFGSVYNWMHLDLAIKCSFLQTLNFLPVK